LADGSLLMDHSQIAIVLTSVHGSQLMDHGRIAIVLTSVHGSLLMDHGRIAIVSPGFKTMIKKFHEP